MDGRAVSYATELQVVIGSDRAAIIVHQHHRASAQGEEMCRVELRDAIDASVVRRGGAEVHDCLS